MSNQTQPQHENGAVSEISKSSYRLVEVPVDGGNLTVGVWGEAGPVVFACHGITASHVSFNALADALGDAIEGGVRLIAPDLRGRGGSNRIDGPWGMRAHSDDVIAVLDFLNIERADVLLGHSMGGFVAAVTAAEHPGRVGSILMVDGGLPIMPALPLHKFPFGEWMIEKLVQRILGPALERLGMTFESRQAYRDFWREHPALKNNWSSYVEDYLDYDLEGEPPNLKPTTSRRAVLQDVRTQLFENLVPRSLKSLDLPVYFLRAPRGLMDAKPLYSQKLLGKQGAKVPDFRASDVEDVNHYTIMLSAQGSAAVAAEIKRMIGADAK